MDGRVFVFFCLLTAVRPDDSSPLISYDKKEKTLNCTKGKFGDEASIRVNYDNSGIHTCIPSGVDCNDEMSNCPKALIKVLSSENLIQLDPMALVSVIVGDIVVTAVIGWAIYSICAQPVTRSSYQGNKASDRQALINNHTPSGGDTYQPLNTRGDEYSTLHAQRKQKKQPV
ncbi:T-cell surface glycoprotein CD3 gamma chain [Carassius auratus]|uniref:T-cell surface glycoprotein CD3 gamma chain n=1 Tax=Carassius auratus TaxID=7957 RepID=A0A6P6QYB0_CARAU|nr:T-cell surface glycoprotein CD3 gamma chain-like [Carassius auratus]